MKSSDDVEDDAGVSRVTVSVVFGCGGVVAKDSACGVGAGAMEGGEGGDGAENFLI